ncbi:MFS transporter [Cryptosporangium sp. NPDC048952]|uniref:MFS transporter n=1 Tax=Cryptosporangium sp. NPDC048952 TaxID=3363961 RepID=UPI00371C6B4A
MLATAQFLVVLTTSIVNVALPAIAEGLTLSPSGLAWVVNAYVLAFGSLLLFGGRLGDVFGRRRVFVSGTAVFAIGAAAASASTNSAVLVAARAVQGVGAALLAPAALGLVFALFPPGSGRARALGVWGAVTGAGGAVGVVLSGVLTDVFGWRSVFLAGLAVAAPILVATRLLVAADVPAGGRIDLVGAGLVTAGLVAATLGLSGTGEHGWISARTGGLLLVGVALLAAFVATQRRIAEPLLRLSVLRTSTVWRANVMMVLLGAAWLVLFYFLPLYQQRVLGYSPIRSGLTQLPLALAVTAASTAAPRVVRRADPRLLLTASLILVGAGLAWLARMPVDGTFITAIAVPSVLIGAGLGAAFVLLTDLSAAGVPTADAGLAGGLINTTRQVGGAVGLAVLSTIATSVGSSDPTAPAPALARGYSAALLGAAALSALSAASAFLLYPRRAPRKEST